MIAEDKWQQGRRDAILAPHFYARYCLSHKFVDQNAMTSQAERRRSVDTLARPRLESPFTRYASKGAGEVFRIEEKFIHFPKVIARFTNYSLETVSCTIQGRETPGWMHYSTADVLLYAFCTNREETELQVHLLAMRELKAWFWPLELEFEEHVMPYTTNKTMTRKVPFDRVPADILFWTGQVP